MDHPESRVCIFCGRVQERDGSWADPTDAEASKLIPSHGICKACSLEHYGLDPRKSDRGVH